MPTACEPLVVNAFIIATNKTQQWARLIMQLESALAR